MKTLTTKEGKVLEVDETLYDLLVEKFERKSELDKLEDILRCSGEYYYISDGIKKQTDNQNMPLGLSGSKSKEQLESILQLNQLCNVVNKLNQSNGYGYLKSTDKVQFYFEIKLNCRTKDIFETAKQLIGEENIKKALTLNYNYGK